MTAKPDKQVALDGADLAAVNGALSFSMQQIIEAQQYGVAALDKRKIDFACIDRALAAAARLVAAHGPDTALPGQLGTTAAGLLVNVQGVAQRAQPYRLKRSGAHDG